MMKSPYWNSIRRTGIFFVSWKQEISIWSPAGHKSTLKILLHGGEIRRFPRLKAIFWRFCDNTIFQPLKASC